MLALHFAHLLPLSDSDEQSQQTCCMHAAYMHQQHANNSVQCYQHMAGAS
jgi:hypothetical protein